MHIADDWLNLANDVARACRSVTLVQLTLDCLLLLLLLLLALAREQKTIEQTNIQMHKQTIDSNEKSIRFEAQVALVCQCTR